MDGLAAGVAATASFVMYVRFRRGLPVFLGSPDHFALRLRKWRLSTRQTVLLSWAATAVLGVLAIVMMLSPTDLAVLLLAAIFLGALGLGLFLRRIDMSL